MLKSANDRIFKSPRSDKTVSPREFHAAKLAPNTIDSSPLQPVEMGYSTVVKWKIYGEKVITLEDPLSEKARKTRSPSLPLWSPPPLSAAIDETFRKSFWRFLKRRMISECLCCPPRRGRWRERGESKCNKLRGKSIFGAMCGFRGVNQLSSSLFFRVARGKSALSRRGFEGWFLLGEIWIMVDKSFGSSDLCASWGKNFTPKWSLKVCFC